MKALSTLAVFACLCTVSRSSEVVDTPNSERVWNILSLDGGGIRGLITATVVKYMEEEGYRYARSNCNIPPRSTHKVSMAEIFDLVAGTSTGSLLATALVIPNDKT